MGVFLLDEPLPEILVRNAPKEASFIRRNLHAKRFFVSEEVGRKIHQLNREHKGLYSDYRQFSRAPFPECYVEFDHPTGRIGLLWAEGRTTLVTDRSPAAIHWSRFTVHIQPEGLLAVDQRKSVPFQPEADRETLRDAAIAMTGVVEILWLLMHRPGVVKAQEVKGRQTVVRGKLRPARAHTVLTIDLAAKDIVKRIVADGSRGSGVREHEVRGTWVHLHHVRSCAHQWEKVERPEFAPERWSLSVLRHRAGLAEGPRARRAQARQRVPHLRSERLPSGKGSLMEDYGPIAIVVVLTVIAFLVPAKYDPAIRLKERNERKRLEAERDV